MSIERKTYEFLKKEGALRPASESPWPDHPDNSGVCMATTEKVKSVVELLKANGCKVEIDLDIGVAIVESEGVEVYRAIQHGACGSGAPWSVRFQSGGKIEWRCSRHFMLLRAVRAPKAK